VFGYISFCRVIYAQMKARRAGVIINVIGAAGEKFPTGYIAGAAGNAASLTPTASGIARVVKGYKELASVTDDIGGD